MTNSLFFIGVGFLRPESSCFPSFALKNSIPTTFPFFTRIFFGIASVTISVSSFFASSISSRSAGISSNPRRYARVTFSAPSRTADRAASNAVEPPPIIMIFPHIFFELSVFTAFKNNNASIMPSAFSPSIPKENDFGAPHAIRIAEYPFFNNVRGLSIRFPVLISTPNPFIQSISLFITRSGRRYGGMA